MTQDFPLPPAAGEIAELVGKRLKEVREAGGSRETVTVDLNGQLYHAEVIDLQLKDLYFNPATHRIRAQRSHQPEREKALLRDPWGSVGQDYLRRLLKADPSDPEKRDSAFDTLKQDLKEYGQNEPGLITYHGVLVNGNTRAAALLELGETSMRVGVLPESATWAEINAVELSLQMREDHRRDYTFLNKLLAMEERREAGLPPEAIAREFRVQVKTYEQSQWILQLLYDQIERSATNGASLRLVDFEDAQEKLRELHRDYMNLAANDPDGAEILKESRMPAIVLRFAKTDVRFIEADFQDSYLSRELPEDINAAGQEVPAQAETLIPGLGIAVPGPSSKVSAARQRTTQLLQAQAQLNSKELDEDKRREAREYWEKVREGYDAAITSAGRDVRLRRKKQMAPERLKDACKSIDLCVGEVVKARGSKSFDEVAFDEALLQLRESVQKLARQAGKGVEDPGEGLSWLFGAVKAEGN
ncbi:hypothetical protein [Streptomyces nanshensis]|uniref:Uncharacterized protein n=1 Tax=Streptomyces nanshensis TaxID=518642 RepID=A0A1E7LA99_9ACTN|nr:hypothetical protein [Streptomyces nanshensis]OEV13119.1 hypothetical protein AN218_04990 [Streptomyces nanshensis]